MIPVITKEQLESFLLLKLPTNDFTVWRFWSIGENKYAVALSIDNGFNVTFNQLYEGIRNAIDELYISLESPYVIGLNQLGLILVSVEDSMKWTFTMQFEVADESDNLETDNE